MNNPKFFIGPMSKNIVDAVIEFSNYYHIPAGLIPSRRQVDYDGGYVNNWTTDEWANYVRGKAPLVVLERDHGGAGQGDEYDNGAASFIQDAKSGLDIIHIDPFKEIKDMNGAADYVKQVIQEVGKVNPDCLFEIGTEQAIKEYSPEELDCFLSDVKFKMESLFHRIKYAVIQSGTAISGTQNTGTYKPARLFRMVKICKRYGLLSKEHNGDYLDADGVVNRFALGLDAINIAPEFGNLETKLYLSMASEDIEQKMFDLCLVNGRWKKWFPDDFNPYDNKEAVIEAAGHYIFSHPEFIEIKKQFREDIDRIVQNNIRDRLYQLHIQAGVL